MSENKPTEEKKPEGEQAPKEELTSEQQAEADKERIAELEKKNEELNGTNKAVVEELKELRKKKAPEETPAPTENPAPTDPDEAKMVSVITKVLSEERQARADENKESALKKFKAENPDFSEENDPTGLKYSAFEREFNGFVQDGLSTEEEFSRLATKAKTLMGKDTAPTSQGANAPNSDPTPGNQPSPEGDSPESQLSETEKKLIADNGMTAERYLELKEKTPSVLEDL